MSSGLLEGRVAIVTGAGRGIGRAHALALADAGAAVVVNDLGMALDGTGVDASVADDVVAEITARGGRAVANSESVSDWDASRRIVEAALDTFGRLDILVNNAGITRFKGFTEVDEEDFDLQLASNLKGTFAMCRHAAEVFTKQGSGRIINTTSNNFSIGTSNAAYAAAKGGVVSLTYILAWELRRHGVTVNAIAPFANTRLNANLAGWRAKLVADGLATDASNAAKDVQQDPAFVSPIVVYLASDAAADVTGLVFRAGSGKIGIYEHPLETRTLLRDEATGPWDPEELVTVLPKTLFRFGSTAPHIE